MKLKSFVTELSFVEDNEVSIEKNTAIPVFEIVVHHGLINNNLLLERTVFYAFFSVVVKLKSLLGLFLTVHIILVGFNDGHTTLTRLNNF